MKKWGALWNNISLTGVTPELDAQVVKRIKLTNQLAMILGVLGFIYIFLFWALGLPSVAAWTILAVILYLSPIAWNRAGKHILASLWFIIFFNVILIFFSFLLGKESGIYLICLGNICLPWIFFRLKHWGFIIFGTLWSVGAFSFIDFGNIQPIVPITPEIQQIIYSTILYGVVFPLLSLCFYYFILQNKLVEDELLKNNNALQKSKELMVELDQAKTHFFTNVSHEFRTPLTLIIGAIEEALTSSNPPLSQEQRRSLQLAQKNGYRLQRLVTNLMDFSKMESGSLNSTFSPIHLPETIRELSSVFSPAIERAGLEFRFEAQKLKEPVYVDTEKIEKILFNLISNALKYTPQGYISIQVKEEGEFAIIQIQDSGLGISPENQKNLFQRFFRVSTANTRSIDGTGIGLAFVNELVKIHGGHIQVESEENAGSTFSVYIPFGKDHLPPSLIMNNANHVFNPELEGYLPNSLDTTPNLDESPTSSNDKTGSQTVLVVDDNVDMRGYLKRVIEKNLSCRVRTCNNGQEALTQIEHSRPNLVLSDIMMPVMNGFELVAKIRANPKNKNLPIILLSARTGEDATIEGLNAGANDYIAKPFSSRELCARINTQLELANVQRKNAELMEALEERSTEMEQMTYIASHDLKEPLRTINSMLQLLKENQITALSTEGQKQLEFAYMSSISMFNLINSLLDFSAVSKKEKLQKMSCNNILQEVFIDLHSLISQSKVIMEVEELPEIKLFPAKIKLLFQNLIHNAIKFKHPSRTPTIHISAQQLPGFVEFQVQDNGRGISEKHLEKVFQIFQRTGNQNAVEGTGIGLAHCKKIVKLHHGKIWVTSKLGEGSTFHFTLSDNLENQV